MGLAAVLDEDSRAPRGASNLEPMVRAALRYVRDVRDAECSSEAECRRVKMKVELETVVRAVVLAESQ